MTELIVQAPVQLFQSVIAIELAVAGVRLARGCVRRTCTAGVTVRSCRARLPKQGCSWIGSVFDPMHDRRGPLPERAHAGCRALGVVFGAPEVDLTIGKDAPGRSRVAVERRADASGIDQARPTRPVALELHVTVTEDKIH